MDIATSIAEKRGIFSQTRSSVDAAGDTSASCRTTMFVSYRRFDSQDVTGRICDRLIARYSARQVFKDVDSIPLGVSFPSHIRQLLNRADVVLVVIGPTWLDCVDEQGQRRLDNPNDFVRLEVELALSKKMPVIPVLVSNARMPQAAELPPSMRRLVERNGIPIRPDPDFNHDISRLVAGLDHLEKHLTPKSVRPCRGASAEPVPTVPGKKSRRELEPCRGRRQQKSGSWPLIIGLASAAVAWVVFLLCLSMFWVLSAHQANSKAPQDAPVARQDAPQGNAAHPAKGAPDDNMAPVPQSPPAPAKSVYVGSEDLAGFGKLTFELYPDQKAKMIDAQQEMTGRWCMPAQDKIEMRFEAVVYSGTIHGDIIQGTAAVDGKNESWTWKVSRQ